MTGDPIKLEPGGTYVVETDSFLNPDQVRNIKAAFESIGVKVFVLDGGLKLARESDEARVAAIEQLGQALAIMVQKGDHIGRGDILRQIERLTNPPPLVEESQE